MYSLLGRRAEFARNKDETDMRADLIICERTRLLIALTHKYNVPSEVYCVGVPKFRRGWKNSIPTKDSFSAQL